MSWSTYRVVIEPETPWHINVPTREGLASHKMDQACQEVCGSIQRHVDGIARMEIVPDLIESAVGQMGWDGMVRLMVDSVGIEEARQLIEMAAGEENQ